MDENVVKIIGIKVTPSSKDPSRLFYNYYYTGKFSSYEVDHSKELAGSSCGVEFSSVDIGCYVGDEVEFKYAKGFQDKATLVGCTIIMIACILKR